MRSLLLGVALLAAAAAGATAPLPVYRPAPGLAGNLSSTGSDTLASLMTLWARRFSGLHPGVTMEVQASGSSTAPPALVEGTADIGPMSRAMKPRELVAFVERFGYAPTALPVAIDAVAVFVHRDNPLSSISAEQLDAIYSATRACGAPLPIRRWGALGLGGSWARRPVRAFGRNSASGTYSYFRAEVLCRGDFRAEVNELPGSASVVQAVGESLGAIGYSSLGYASAGVRALPVRTAGGRTVPATRASAASGDYPLARYLYAYVNRAPGRPLPPVERAFFDFVYSHEGQRLVLQDGYVPLPGTVIARQRAELGL